MQENSVQKKDKRLFVVHFSSRISNEIHTHYFYTDQDGCADIVKALIDRYDQGDADPDSGTYPVQIRDWSDVDPVCYDLIFFAQNEELDQQELTLLEFMQDYWIYGK